MRLSEFADPKAYTVSVDDAANYPSQLLPMWPERPADKFAPSVLSRRNQPPTTKLTDAPSIGSHVGSGDLRSRRGARQWPTA
jgi:hypothetical protein